jgi:hypothetical protein
MFKIAPGNFVWQQAGCNLAETFAAEAVNTIAVHWQ